ncbi:hypothetical protein D1007_26093 [Hordeum vulgare]|nr:hypothetical protein D1007_26093 [Hordeum vulgare]
MSLPHLLEHRPGRRHSIFATVATSIVIAPDHASIIPVANTTTTTTVVTALRHRSPITEQPRGTTLPPTSDLASDSSDKQPRGTDAPAGEQPRSSCHYCYHKSRTRMLYAAATSCHGQITIKHAMDVLVLAEAWFVDAAPTCSSLGGGSCLQQWGSSLDRDKGEQRGWKSGMSRRRASRKIMLRDNGGYA